MTFEPPPHRTDLLWYGIDFDGTICDSEWSPENPSYVPGPPYYWVLFQLQSIRSKGYKAVIHSARPWSDYELIESYMDYYGLPYDRIVLGKLLCKVYVDDRAKNANEVSWL